MATLLVRNIDDKLVQALKVRAGKHGISVEAEHRRILEAILLPRKKKEFCGNFNGDSKCWLRF